MALCNSSFDFSFKISKIKVSNSTGSAILFKGNLYSEIVSNIFLILRVFKTVICSFFID